MIILQKYRIAIRAMHKSSKIKKLILDFGGVIYHISHQKQKDTFEQMGFDDFNTLYSQVVQNPLFARFECGKISDNDFREQLNALIDKSFTPQQTDRAWNSILVGFDTPTIKLLEQLKSRYSIFLLSNTNAIHYKIYAQQFLESFGYDINGLFEKCFWSFKIGKRKPNRDVYEMIISECAIDKDNAIFIDDTEANIIAAERAGIRACLLTPGQKLADFFDEDFRVIL